jgi:hypothetical protein
MKKAIATLALLTMLLMPSPAFAWFGWLDRLSGAGSFWGLLFNVRAVCFGEKYRGPTLAEVLDARAVAERLETQADADLTAAGEAYARSASTKNFDVALRLYEIAAASSRASADAWEAARKTSLESASSWARVLGEPPPNAPGAGAGVSRSDVKPRDPGAPAPGAAVSLDQEAVQQRIDLILKPGITTSRAAAAQAKALVPEPPVAQRQFEANQQRAAFALSLGVIFSACREDMARRSSIDVETGFWQVLDDDSQYEGDRLSTAKVAYTLRLFDVLDYSVGAGVFWITSRRYDAVRGVYFEPGRLYLHAPESWSTLPFKTNVLKRILAIPVFSAATVLFPNGFRENAFGDNERIRGELVPSFSVFANVRPAKRRSTGTP